MPAEKKGKHPDPANRFVSPPFRNPEAVAKAWQSVWMRASFQAHLALIADRLFAAAASSSDPDQAIIHFTRLVEAFEVAEEPLSVLTANPGILNSLTRLLGDSALLSEYIIGHPEVLEKDLSSPDLGKFKPRENRRESLSRRLPVAGEGSVRDVLREFKRHELFLIGLRDLLKFAPVDEITLELSDLAEIVLEAALGECMKKLVSRYGWPMVNRQDESARHSVFSILGMGKLGGSELNFSSDIDLLFVYDEEGETEGGQASSGSPPITNNAFFTKLAEELVQMLTEVTAQGRCYRVDLGLRPEGRSGALVRSLYNYEVYYESWGVTWERQALIKCRPAAGDQELGRRFIEMIQPFVYRKYLDFVSLSEIKQMKERIDRHVDHRGESARQVKLGRGGIREIEFIVQSLQLIHGGRMPDIRERQTLKAIERLAHRGLLTDGESKVLSDAYRFLRRVEHRVQIVQGAQTHLLPDAPEPLRALSRRLDFPNEQALLDAYRGHTASVRKIFEDLFYQPNESSSSSSIPEETAMIMGREIDRDQVSRIFDRYGILNTEKAYQNLRLLLEGQEARPLISPRGRSVLANLMPDLLKRIQKSPDPDLAFDHLERFLAQSGARDLYLRTLGEHPKVMDLVTELFGTSAFLSTILIQNTGMFERFTRPGYLEAHKTAEMFTRELDQYDDSKKVDDESFLKLLRYKKEEVFRIGLRDISGLADLSEVTAELTSLADGCLSHMLSMCVRANRAQHGMPIPLQEFAIIGLGKLGGREMNYGSDLDIIFVHGDVASNEEEMTGMHRLAERVIQEVSLARDEGILYKIDARLRPFGRKGMITQTIDGYRTYFEEHAETWERQALIKARPIAGNAALATQFMDVVERFTYGYGLLKSEALAIAAMRDRLENERAATSAGLFDLKYGRGGIVDVEFAVQFLQLRYGYEYPELRHPKTVMVLDALVRKEFLSKNDYESLRSGYLFLRRVENRLRILHDESDNIVSLVPKSLEALARRLAYGRGGGARLLSEIEATCLSIDRVARRIIYAG